MSAITKKRIENAMIDLAWHSSCSRERTEGWNAKDCRELKLKSKCPRCNVLVRVEKMLRSATKETSSSTSTHQGGIG